MYKKKGFTLIELLVVISIISLLSSIILTSVSIAREKAQVAAGKKFSSYLDRNLGFYSVGSWSFEEINGDIIDKSSKNQTGYITGGVERIDDCDLKFGNCLYFPPSGGIVRSYNNPDQPFVDGVILAAWIKPDLISSYSTIISKSWNNESQYTLDIRNGEILFYTWTCQGIGPLRTYVYSGKPVVKVGNWQHVAVSIDKVSETELMISFYHNGKLISEILKDNVRICNSGNTNLNYGIEIGSSWTYSGNTIKKQFYGYIDEARQIMTTIDGLSSKEIIRNLYASR